MQLKQLLTDESAVSPVIGVILMVAITVILAAITGVFVLGVGESQQNVPQAAFDFGFDPVTSNVTVAHAGGDTFESDNTASLSVRYVTGGLEATESFQLPVASGELVEVTADRGSDVQVVWTSSSADRGQVVGVYEVPT